MTDKDLFWHLLAKRLSGEATTDELLELEKLLRNDPGLHYSSQTVTDLWKPVDLPEDSALNAFRQHVERMERLGIDFHPISTDTENFANEKPVTQRGFTRMTVSIGLFAIVIICCWLIIGRRTAENKSLQTASLTSPSEIFTKNGSKTNVVLPDGTQVWLNAGSRLLYDKQYGNSIREVSLSGEAFFDVVKNKEKPFVIHTGTLDIRVLGTAFNVKAYPGEKTTETSLVRGSVEVTIHDRPLEKVILKPNEKLVVENNEVQTQKVASFKKQPFKVSEPVLSVSHLTYTKRDSTLVETAWVQNKLVFEDETFWELAKKMERWYGVSIRFDSSLRDTLHFTGSFSNENIQQALAALRLSAKFSYVVRNNQITISK